MSGPLPFRLDVDHFVKRLLIDCLLEQTSEYWLKRADDFEKAKPRLGDFNGGLTAEESREKVEELNQIATACRNAAKLARSEEERIHWSALFDQVWEQAS